ncbi:sugar phosphate isomerase/epimerase family protein [Pseudomonas gingeri]
MRLSISNIAWDVSEDEAIARLLRTYNIDAIDIAPGKYFPKTSAASREQILEVREFWSSHGVEIIGMQALLFGTTGLNVFGTASSQSSLIKHLEGIFRIAEGLGATKLVFGSPKNRDRHGLDDEQVLAIALPFFRTLGDLAQSYGVSLCLEPNPVCYGANFMTTASETLRVAKLIAHPAIKMQFDTGASIINCEDSEDVLLEASDYIGHIHLSEPELAPLGDRGSDHGKISRALFKYLPQSSIATIEMLATTEESHLASIQRALKVAVAYYSSQACRGDI